MSQSSGRLGALGWGLVAIGTVAACSSAPSADETADSTKVSDPAFITQNLDAEQRSNLLVRVFVGPRQVIEFYEPVPGKILLSQAGEVPALPVGLPAGNAAHFITVLDVFRAIAPDAPVPDVLLQADRRRTACADPSLPLDAVCGEKLASVVPVVIRRELPIAAPGGAVPVDSVPPPVSDRPGTPAASGGDLQPSAGDFVKKVGGSCDSSWFQGASNGSNRFCPTSGYYTWCTLDWWNGRWVDSGSWTDETWGTVCADIGNVTMKVSGSGGGGTWSVPQGSWRQWWKYRDLSCGCFPFCTHYCDFTTRYDVLDASGDRFQFGGVFQRLD